MHRNKGNRRGPEAPFKVKSAHQEAKEIAREIKRKIDAGESIDFVALTKGSLVLRNMVKAQLDKM